MIKHSVLLALSWGTLSMLPALVTDLPPQIFPIYGGSGGAVFARSCNSGQVLSGFRYREGFWLDAIGLLCRPVLANGDLGPETSVGSMTGGGGGTTKALSCPSGSVITGLKVNFGSFVNGIYFECTPWRETTRIFEPGGPTETHQTSHFNWSSRGDARCEAQAQPAHGIRGRSAGYVDALGLVCNEP